MFVWEKKYTKEFKGDTVTPKERLQLRVKQPVTVLKREKLTREALTEDKN